MPLAIPDMTDEGWKKLISAPESGSAGYAFNQELGTFLTQNLRFAAKPAVARKAFLEHGRAVANCLPDDMYNELKTMTNIQGQQFCERYNEIAGTFRENLITVAPELGPMLQRKITQLSLSEKDKDMLNLGIEAVNEFNASLVAGGAPAKMNDDQMASAQESIAEVMRYCDTNTSFTGMEDSFSYRKSTGGVANRLQTAINFFSRSSDATTKAYADKMIRLGCTYKPTTNGTGGTEIAANSRNIDFLLICVLPLKFYLSFAANKDATDAHLANIIGTFCNASRSGKVPVAITGCPSAIIEKGTNPRLVPPYCLTPERMAKAFKCLSKDRTNPEDVMKVGCQIPSLLAISKCLDYIWTNCTDIDRRKNLMYEYGRYLKGGIMGKEGVEFVNMMNQSAFGVTIKTADAADPEGVTVNDPRTRPDPAEKKKPDDKKKPKPEPDPAKKPEFKLHEGIQYTTSLGLAQDLTKVTGFTSMTTKKGWPEIKGHKNLEDMWFNRKDVGDTTEYIKYGANWWKRTKDPMVWNYATPAECTALDKEPETA